MKAIPSESLIGKVYGRIEIVEILASERNQQGRMERMVRAKCSCGKWWIGRLNALRRGNTKSCGCIVAGGTNVKHGYARKANTAQEYKIWLEIKKRCFRRSSAAYPKYGGAGITMCEQWRNDFCAFLAYVGQRPSKGHSIDRIDGKRGYEPGNVRWATSKEQARNICTNHLLSFKGSTRSVAEWSEMTGIKYRTIMSRLNLGWPADLALSAPASMHTRLRHFGVESRTL